MKGMVLLNMGGPNNLDEVELFLKNMFNDPNILTIKNSLLRRFIASMITNFRKKEAKKNYAKLGGKSPLNFYTDLLIAKLQKALPDTFITKAMRYTPPFAKDAIKELMAHNVQELFLLPLYPHYSTTTTKSSLEDFYNEAKKAGYRAKFYDIESFYENSLYNQTLLARIEEAIEDSKNYELIFSAHSLPQSIVQRGDPYPEQIKEHTKILQKMLGNKFKAYHLAFQSKLGPVKWLEPSLEEVLKSLEGKKVLIVPLSFTIDNSETEFELHVEYKTLAQEVGLKEYRVAKCPNDHELFVKTIVELYQKAL